MAAPQPRAVAPPYLHYYWIGHINKYQQRYVNVHIFCLDLNPILTQLGYGVRKYLKVRHWPGYGRNVSGGNILLRRWIGNCATEKKATWHCNKCIINYKKKAETCWIPVGFFIFGGGSRTKSYISKRLRFENFRFFGKRFRKSGSTSVPHSIQLLNEQPNSD